MLCSNHKHFPNHWLLNRSAEHNAYCVGSRHGVSIYHMDRCTPLHAHLRRTKSFTDHATRGDRSETTQTLRSLGEHPQPRNKKETRQHKQRQLGQTFLTPAWMNGIEVSLRMRAPRAAASLCQLHSPAWEKKTNGSLR